MNRLISSTNFILSKLRSAIRLLCISAALIGLSFGSVPLYADDATWDGSEDSLWSTLDNWGAGTAPGAVPGTGDTATFDETGVAGVIDLSGGITIDQLIFNNAGIGTYTIGVAGSDTITFDNGGGIDTNATMGADQIIAANIILGDGTGNTFRIDTESTTGKIQIDGDIDTGTGTGNAGVQRLEIGIANSTNVAGRLVEINGDINETGDATRIELFVSGADLTLNGTVNGSGNTQRSIIQGGATYSVGATGSAGQGQMSVRFGTLELNNITTAQNFDNGLVLGDANQGNGDATVTIASGATLNQDSNITYNADNNTANLGLIQGGTIDFEGNTTVIVNDNTSIAGAELQISSDITTDNSSRTITKNGQGTLLLSGSNISGANFTVQNGILQLETDGALNSTLRDIIVQNQNAASGISANVELDLNGADAQIDNLSLGAVNTQATGGAGTVSVTNTDFIASGGALTLEDIFYREGTRVELAFDNETGTDFGNNQQVSGATSGATGYIVSATRSGTTGTFSLRNVSGTFLDDETLTVTGNGTGTPVMANGTQTVVNKLNDRATISANLNLTQQSIWTVDDGANTTGDLVVNGDISDDDNTRDIVIQGEGTVRLGGSNTHDRTTIQNQLTILDSGDVFGEGDTGSAGAGNTGTNAASNQDGQVYLRQRNVASSNNAGLDLYNGAVTLDINGQDVIFHENLIIGDNTSNITASGGTVENIMIIDSAGGGKLIFGGLNGNNDDNNISYQNFADNRTATIATDIRIENSGMTITAHNGADDIDLLITGNFESDTGGRAVSKGGAGVLRLTGVNNTAGNGIDILNINNGILQIDSIASLGDNDIGLGSNTTNGTLDYRGSGETLNEEFRIGDNNGGATRIGAGSIINNGSGTLIITSPSANFNQARTSGVAKTITFDTASADITVTDRIIDNNGTIGEIGIIKNGTETLTLGGDNTYTGSTTVNAGTLVVNGTNTSAIGVAAGATLGGSGSTTGSITLANTANLTVDGSVGGLTTTDGTTGLDLTGVVSGGIDVTFTGSAPSPITLLDYGGTATGFVAGSGATLFNLINAPTIVRSGTGITDTGTAITFDSGNAVRTWDNTSGNSLWIAGNTTDDNWVEGDMDFLNSDSVIFDDTPGADQTVTLSNSGSGVTVSNATFSNVAHNYTVTGESVEVTGTLTFAIGNDTSATTVAFDSEITGTGSVYVGDQDGVLDANANIVTISQANSYTGGTTIAEGITQITDVSALGTGTVTLQDDAGGSPDTNRNPTLDLDFASGQTMTNNFVISNLNGDKILRFANDGVNTAELSGTFELLETSNEQFRIETGANETLTISGEIFGPGDLIKDNTGTLILTNANNSFSGNLNAGQGTLQVESLGNTGGSSHSGSGLIVIGLRADDGTLSYSGSGETTDRQVQVGNRWFGNGNYTGAGSIENNGSGALIFGNSAFNVAESDQSRRIGARTLKLGGTYNGDANQIQGAIIDNESSDGGSNGGPDGDETVALNVDTAGTWALSGTNLYTGETTVTSGTLLINGDNSGATGAVTVNGGTLGGNGTLGGTVTIAAGANHTAGTFGTDTATDAGIQTINNTLTYASGATVTWDLISNSVSNAGTDFDQFNLTGGGSLAFDGDLTFDIDFGSAVDFEQSFWNAQLNEWKVWDTGALITIPGGTITITNSANSAFNSAFELMSGNRDGSDSNGIWLVQTSAIPEPSTFSLVGLGLAGFGWFARKRRKLRAK